MGRSCQFVNKKEPCVNMELHRKMCDESEGQGHWEPQKCQVRQAFPNYNTVLFKAFQQGSIRTKFDNSNRWYGIFFPTVSDRDLSVDTSRIKSESDVISGV